MKTLVIGTSHAANCFTAIKNSANHQYLDVHMAALGINAWKLILDRCRHEVIQGGIFFSGEDLNLTPTHEKRFQSLNLSLRSLSSFDLIIAVDFFFKGWQRVVDNFAGHKGDSIWYLNSADSSPFPAGLALVSSLIEVSGAVSGHGGPYSGETMHTPSLTAFSLLQTIAIFKRADAKFVLLPAPMHPSVVAPMQSYQSMTHFRSSLCALNGIVFLPQPPNTISENVGTLPIFSRTDESVTSNPVDMDGHMGPEYWLMHVDHAGLIV